MAFHNLASTKPPKNLCSLLGLSLQFVPNPLYNVLWKVYHSTILHCLVNNLKVKTFMDCKIQGADNEDDGYNKRMYVRTDWTPPENLFPFPKELPRRLQAFTTAIKSLVRRCKCPATFYHTNGMPLNNKIKRNSLWYSATRILALQLLSGTNISSWFSKIT
jgi:hypothetical protein